MSRGSVVVFAKRPAPGEVKTRLCPPFTPEQAADFYAAMLADVLEATAGYARTLELDAVLAVWPPDALTERVQHAPPAYRVVPQAGADLAARMTRALAEQLAAGHDRVLLRGSDSPALDAEAFEEVVAGLDDHDLVVCPDLDGGYNLVGLRRAAPGLFEHPMSTDRVLDQTLAHAEALGLRARVLEPRFDVDTAEDLRLLARVRAERRGAPCRRTFAWLDAEGLWPPEPAG